MLRFCDLYNEKKIRHKFDISLRTNGERITYRIPKGVKIISLKYRESGLTTQNSAEVYLSDQAFLEYIMDEIAGVPFTLPWYFLWIALIRNAPAAAETLRARWRWTVYALDNHLSFVSKGAAYTPAYTIWATRSCRTARYDSIFLADAQLVVSAASGLITCIRAIKKLPYTKDYVGFGLLAPDALPLRLLLAPRHRAPTLICQPWKTTWYYKALQCVIDIGPPAYGKLRGIADVGQRAETKTAAHQMFLGCRSGLQSAPLRVPDDRSNAVAVLAGVADPDSMRLPRQRTQFTLTLCGDCVCEMGYMEDAQQRIRTRYKEMVEYDYSTLWEFWDHGGTLNHAWSGGPLLTMSQYMAGIEPAEAGYTKFSVKPMLGDLTSLECTVPSVRGYITVNIL